MDKDALIGLLLCECRMLYQNKYAWEYVLQKLEPDFKKNHEALKKRIPEKEVKECVNDVLLMVFDN
jgi:hypothetical protein